VGFRLDSLLVLTTFRHSDPDGTTVDKRKLMPGADLLFEASYYFTRWTAVVVGGGGEVLFGHTDVFVDGGRATTLNPFRPALEAGFRVGF
jgi:hypothetical protein